MASWTIAKNNYFQLYMYLSGSDCKIKFRFGHTKWIIGNKSKKEELRKHVQVAIQTSQEILKPTSWIEEFFCQ